MPEKKIRNNIINQRNKKKVINLTIKADLTNQKR